MTKKKDEDKKEVQAPEELPDRDRSTPDYKAVGERIDKAVQDYQSKNPIPVSLEEILSLSPAQQKSVDFAANTSVAFPSSFTPIPRLDKDTVLDIPNVDLQHEIARLRMELKGQQAMNARDRAETKNALDVVGQLTNEKNELQKKVDLVRAEQKKLAEELANAKTNEAALKKGYDQMCANVENLSKSLEASNQKRKDLRTALANL